MNNLAIMLLVILFIAVWISFWLWVDQATLIIPRESMPLSQWLKKPKNAGLALRWSVRIAALLAIILAFVVVSPNYKGEVMGIAFTVLVIEEVMRLRNRLEFKQSIILQMRSLSNDFAVDAARIAKDENWLFDGSLQNEKLAGANLACANLERAALLGANLRWAILTKAYLKHANLDQADLTDANLNGADIRWTSFQDARLTRTKFVGAKYNDETKWPSGFDYQATEAVLDNSAPDTNSYD